ncbi:succinylglutamate desuccinylase/aspartoacylase [Nitritalea halalkaliphila LW7]|uniref:Succinylglutamate desuccinylase/aspartoacylase n=1 Tax=Nitritalea halalkaliphila LW7 TaxID=1189621 RepID=I5C6V7_9BACT|nr:succinylglutamate desuccinylase/aspartoacylase [Nitritalea halalkaliphila LW7]
MELAKAFGTHYILNSPHIDKSFRKEAYKQKKSILVYEGGESSRMDEFAIEEAVAGCKRLLHARGIIDDTLQIPAPKETLLLKESSWQRAKVSGIFNSTVALGDAVRKGQILAKISDPYGQVKVPVKASTNGFVVGLNNNPVVNAGDALIHIGKA